MSQAGSEPLVEAPSPSRARLRVRELARNKSDIRRFSHFPKKRIVGIAQRKYLAKHEIEDKHLERRHYPSVRSPISSTQRVGK